MRPLPVRLKLQAPVLVVLLAGLVIGLAMLLSALYVRYRDVKPIWEVMLQVLFYATPVIYAVETIDVAQWIREAIMLLGYRKLRLFATLVALGDTGDRPPELAHMRIPVSAEAAATSDAAMTVFDRSRGYVVAFTGAAYSGGTWSARGATVTARSHGRIRSRWAPYALTARYLVLFALACFFLMPVYALLVTALKSPVEVSVVRMWQWPEALSLDNFAIVWPKLREGFANSVLMALPASVISSLLGAANGFVLAKWRFPGADFVFALILFGMFIPYQAVLIPMFHTMSYTGLRGGLPGLVLVHVIYGLPITTLIFRSYFAGISEELIEAAKVDGAGMLSTFFYVALPIAPPAFAVSMIWQFTSAWNTWLPAVSARARMRNTTLSPAAIEPIGLKATWPGPMSCGPPSAEAASSPCEKKTARSMFSAALVPRFFTCTSYTASSPTAIGP